MIVDRFHIPYKYGETIKLKPLYDIHAGHVNCDKNELKKYLADSDESTYFIGGGDMIDAVICSDVKRYRKSGDDTKSEAIIDEQIETIYDVIQGYRERILGLMLGNHEDTILTKCGTNPIKRLCAMLSTKEHDVKYLGYSCLIKLCMRTDKGIGRSLDIRAHHGWGGGTRTQGGSITKYSNDIKYWYADIFLFGHDHRRQFDEVPRLALSGKKLVARPQLICLCGSYKKSYSVDGSVTYEEKGGFPPTHIGGINILIKPDMHKGIIYKAEY